MRDGVAWKAVERNDSLFLLEASRKKRGAKKPAADDMSTEWLKGLLSDLYIDVLREPLPVGLRDAMRELEDELESSREKH